MLTREPLAAGERPCWNRTAWTKPRCSALATIRVETIRKPRPPNCRLAGRRPASEFTASAALHPPTHAATSPFNRLKSAERVYIMCPASYTWCVTRASADGGASSCASDHSVALHGVPRS